MLKGYTVVKSMAKDLREAQRVRSASPTDLLCDEPFVGRINLFTSILLGRTISGDDDGSGTPWRNKSLTRS